MKYLLVMMCLIGFQSAFGQNASAPNLACSIDASGEVFDSASGNPVDINRCMTVNGSVVGFSNMKSGFACVSNIAGEVFDLNGQRVQVDQCSTINGPAIPGHRY